MKKFLFLTILFFAFPTVTYGATEFVSIVDPGNATGTDYTTLSGWESAIDSDLTAASNKVFAGTKTGTIADGASVTGSVSGATGTVYHSTASQLYLNVTGGTFQSGSDTNAKLLMHMDDTGLTDTIGHTPTLNGNVTRSSTQSKFGGYSGYFDGDGDYITFADSNDWDFGTGDFTVEAQVYFNSFNNPGADEIIGNCNIGAGSNGWILYYNDFGSGSLKFSAMFSGGWGIDISGTVNLNTGQWYHLAVVRTSGTIKFFVDGTQVGTDASEADSITGSNSLAIGARYDGTDPIDAYVDEVRISNVARWTSNFSAPTAAYQTTERIEVDASNYFTPSNAGDSVIAVAKCRTTNGAADTTAVTIDGWTTGASNYVKIYTDPSEPYRHEGVWDEGKYRINTNSANSLFVKTGYVRIDGLQVGSSYAAGNSTQLVITMAGATSGSDIQVSNNIFRRMTHQSSSNYEIGVVWLTDANITSGVLKVWNNVIYDFINGNSNSSGVYLGEPDATLYMYSNTVYNNNIGVYQGPGTRVLKNNIFNDNTASFDGTSDATSAYNITNQSAQSGAFGAAADSGTTDSAAANKLIQSGQNFASTVKVGAIVKNTTDTTYSYVTAVDSNTQLSIANDIMATSENYTIYTNMYGNVTFEDESNDDFHLDSSDTVARNKGVILYDSGDDSNLYFTTDIDNNARLDSATAWDIGADENIAKIYRSVGPSATTALITGKGPAASQYQANHLTISGITATFELPLPDNVGVGDVIQYDADANGTNDAVAIIDKRFSSFQYRIKAEYGAAPTAMAVPDIDWTIFRAHTSLSGAEAGTKNASIALTLNGGNRDMVTNQEQWNFACYANGTTADTAVATITGWTTSADAYIKIYTPTESNEVGTSQRHAGKWDDAKYKMAPAANNGAISIQENYVRTDGLQILITESGTASPSGIRTFTVDAGGSDIRISSCIIKGATSGTGYPAGVINYDADATTTVLNTIVYDFTGSGSLGFASSYGVMKAYNCTGVDNKWGFYLDGGTFNVYNSMSYGDVNWTSISGGDYNASSDTDDPPGTHDQTSVASTDFLDYTNDDFHLSPAAAKLKNTGYDFSNDTTYAIAVRNSSALGGIGMTGGTDIDSYGLSQDAFETRPYSTTWDIGADEVIAKIYRSVAPDDNGDNTIAALATGASNHLNISGSTATFDTALPYNVGVGDALEYDDDNNGTIDASDSIAFITARTSNTVFTIKTSTGAVPTAPSAADEIHWNINRAYTSLSNAEAGTENANIDADLRNFDGGNRDIKANSEQWNFACYANGTTADTTVVTIDGWTTAADNYIKIYTPTAVTEVGISQRHNGIYSTSYYRMAPATGIPLTVSDEDVRIEGLQFYSADSDGTYVNGATGTSRIQFSQNIIKGNSTAAKRGVYLNATGSTSTAKIWNNFIYDYSGAGSGGIYWNDADWTPYIYNNTFQNDAIGLDRGNDTIHYTKNNLISATNAFNGTFTDSDTNNNYNSISENSEDVAIGTNGKYNQTFTFANETGDDFHLAPADAGAKNFGADLSQDPIWQKYMAENTSTTLGNSYDIDGSGRPRTGFGSWDIGADEVATDIYRSNAPSATSALATGSVPNHLNISGSTATFDTAPGTTVGVGDALEYDSDNNASIDAVAFITARTSSTVYTIKSAVGGTPVPQTTADEVHWNLFRAYTSLYSAERGDENDTLTDTVENFDDWTAGDTISADDVGRNLGTYNEQWNIACYANSTTPDSTAVIIDGWTTYPTNYIRIYTPTAVTEVGISQRHSGIWTADKYILTNSAVSPLSSNEENLRIDGLQLYTAASGTYDYALNVYAAGIVDYRFSNLIITGPNTGTATTNNDGITLGNASAGSTARVWNTVIYGFKTVAGYDSGIRAGDADTAYYFYNITTVNNDYGIRADANVIVTAKNIYAGGNRINDYVALSGAAINKTTCASSDATGGVGLQNIAYSNANFTNVTVGSENLHLTATSALKNAGTQLCADTIIAFNTDIDNETRNCGVDTWDIGADEVIQAIIQLKENVQLKRGVQLNTK